MTDEELAKGWVTDNTGFHPKEPLGKIAVRTFLAGLKAGRPQWHKVADGDYPPYDRGDYTIDVLTDCGAIAYYKYNLDYWIEDHSGVVIDPPIAWCEIPKFEEDIHEI